MEKTNSSTTIRGTKECIMETLGTEDLFIFEVGIIQASGGWVNGRGGSEMADMEKHIMEGLGDLNISRIGVCGVDGDYMDDLFRTIIRSIERDNLFDTIVMELVQQKSNLIEIQHNIACQLGLRNQQEEKKRRRLGLFTRKKKEVINENAKQLSDRIRAQPKILFILRDLHTTLDLAKLGIPLDVDHIGCKLILTSKSEEILSKMNVQRTVTA